MDKKALKRLLKLYKSDLNSMADESIYYRQRAEKAEAFIEQLTETIVTMAAEWQKSREDSDG